MIRTWLTVITTVTLIISGLLFLRSTYNRAYEAGKNAERVIVLEDKNKELSEALEAQQKNIEQANNFDEENEVRITDNDNTFTVPKSLFPDANRGNPELLEKQFLETLSKLR